MNGAKKKRVAKSVSAESNDRTPITLTIERNYDLDALTRRMKGAGGDCTHGARLIAFLLRNSIERRAVRRGRRNKAPARGRLSGHQVRRACGTRRACKQSGADPALAALDSATGFALHASQHEFQSSDHRDFAELQFFSPDVIYSICRGIEFEDTARLISPIEKKNNSVKLLQRAA